MDLTPDRKLFLGARLRRLRRDLGLTQTAMAGDLRVSPSYLNHIERYLDHNWTPEQGETNPFLHLSLHLSIQEQAAIDQPFGIADIHRRLCAKHNDDWVAAEHEMMEALAETLWQAQRYGQGLDVNAYMTRLRRLVNLGQEDAARLNPHEVAQQTPPADKD